MKRFCLLLAASTVLLPAAAQTHIVKKQENVVRATAVYEWTGDPAKPSASRLVPVTLFIDGKLEDAGVYLARPVPLALETGTVFEAERAGVAQGTVELAFARHYDAAGGSSGDAGSRPAGAQFDDGWEGFGVFHPRPAERLVEAKPSGPLSKIEVSGGRSGGPKFASRPDTEDKAEAKKPDAAAAADKSSAGKASGAEKQAGTDDSARAGQRSRADRRASAQDTDDPEDKAERPTLRRRDPKQREEERKKNDASTVKAVETADDPDRPVLTRGKPAGSLGDDDFPGLRGIPSDMHQMVVVSDAANRPEHSFAREWEDEAERATVKQKLEAVARQKLAAYGLPVGPPAPLERPSGATIAAGGAAVTPDNASTVAAPPVLRRGVPVAPETASPRAGAPVATSAAPTSAARTSAAPTAAGTPKASPRKAAAGAKASTPARAAATMELTNEDLRGYTLSYGGAATFYFTATAPGRGYPDRYVTLVAQQQPTGELQVAMSNVTDSAHLDRSPRTRLVDVVDAEASNRASLLMELRGSGTRQFALYRVIGAEAAQTFVSGSQ